MPGTGNGLFAAKRLAAGTVIGDYTVGTQEITSHQVQALKDAQRCTHVACLRGRYFDGSRARVGLIQRAPRPDDVAVALRPDGRLVLTRDVAMHEELFMVYGSGYTIAITEALDEEELAQREAVRREREAAAEGLRKQREAVELEQQWEQGTGVFRRELGPVRRAERVEARRVQREQQVREQLVHRLIERERAWQHRRVRVSRRDPATGEPRATQARSAQPSPTGIDDGDTSWAVMGGRMEVFHRY